MREKRIYNTIISFWIYLSAFLCFFLRKNKTHKCTEFLLTNKWLTIDFVVTKQTIWFSTVEMFSFKKKNVNLKCTCQFTNLVLLLWCNNGFCSAASCFHRKELIVDFLFSLNLIGLSVNFIIICTVFSKRHQYG